MLFRSVVAPADWRVYSNSAAPEPVVAGDGFATWRFPPTGPIATYITALVAGQFHVDKGTVLSAKGELPADLVCRASMADYLDAERIRTTTQRGFEVYEQAYGTAYPFDSYDQLFLPEYNAGAMENAGCVTLRDEYLFRSQVTAEAYDRRDNTILHEPLFRQAFAPRSGPCPECPARPGPDMRHHRRSKSVV